MKQLLSSLEKIDLECHRFPNEKINKKALRMDGEQGIRKQLGLDRYNSCDYLSVKNEDIYLIEISDLKSQMSNINKKNDNLPIKSIKKIINKEIRLKMMGSLIILFRIPTKFSSVSHEKIHTKKITAIIVLCSDDQSDIYAFDYLQTDLKNALAPLVTEIKVMNIPVFNLFLGCST